MNIDPDEALKHPETLCETIDNAEKFLQDNQSFLSPTEYIERKIVILFLIDQGYRTLQDDLVFAERFRRGFPSIDDYTSHELKEILKSPQCLSMQGWFEPPQFSDKIADYAFIIPQHADYDLPFQRAVLARMAQSVSTSQKNLTLYAYLHDRVSINSGVPQRYGTQGQETEDGTWHPFECEAKSPEEVEKLGVELGMRNNKGQAWTLTSYFRHMNENIMKVPNADQLAIRFLPVAEYHLN